MGAQIGLHTAAAGEERANFEPLPDVNAAGALGTQKPLVPGEAEDVDAHFLHIDLENSGSLGGIDDVNEPMPSGDGTDFAISSRFPVRLEPWVVTMILVLGLISRSKSS